MPLMKRFAAFLIDWIAKYRRPGAHLLVKFARRVIRAYQNEDLDMRTNGEFWLQNAIARRGSITVMDVGANTGEWCSGLLDSQGEVIVYCYEAVPSTYHILIQNIRDTRAHLINKALSSAAGEISLNEVPEMNHISSVYDVRKFSDGYRSSRISVPAVTGDQEMERLGLARIDFLKVDTEGHDYDVLLGFRNAIAKQRVDVIQFEYNAFTAIARKSLRDFYDILESQFTLCRLLPDRLEAHSYSRSLEDFRQSNWVAVRKGLADAGFVRHLNIRPAVSELEIPCEATKQVDGPAANKRVSLQQMRSSNLDGATSVR